MADMAMVDGRTGYYTSVNLTLLEQVEPSARRILELGCGAGAFARALRSRQAVLRYVGIDMSREALDLASGAIDTALQRNLDDLSDWMDDHELSGVIASRDFDHVVLGDVLEHLYAPSVVLQQAVRYLRPGGSALICMPNVQHWSVLAQLMHGHWPQVDEGLFDRTHIRWFTLRDMVVLVEGCGLVVEKVVPRIFHPQVPQAFLKALEPAARVLGIEPDRYQQLALPLQYVLVGRKPQ